MTGDGLFRRLRLLSKADLSSLLTTGLRISEDEFAGMRKEELVMICSKELRAAAGSSIRRRFRGEHDFPYKKILIDVADKLTEGVTFVSWTEFKLNDGMPERVIENRVLELFEHRARKWWKKLSSTQKKEFVGGLNAVLRGERDAGSRYTGDAKVILTQQVIENVIQNGVVFWLSKMAAPGLLAKLGVSVVGHVGWLILLQTVGLMGGLKIAIFGVGGLGALGGAVGYLGGAAIGGALAIPGVLFVLDGPAYRKSIPTVVMLLARSRVYRAQRKSGVAGSHRGPHRRTRRASGSA